MRMDQLERQVLHFAVELAQSQAQGDRRVYVEGLDGDAPALVGAHAGHGLQVVLAVGQLDQHDAQVARHRHQHLAEILRLRLLVGRKFHLVELGQAVNEIGNLAPEPVGELALARRRVLENVMQESSGNGCAIHAPFDHGAGDRQRMRDVGLARNARLVGMGVRREGIRLLDARYVGRG